METIALGYGKQNLHLILVTNGKQPITLTHTIIFHSLGTVQHFKALSNNHDMKWCLEL